MTLFNLENLRTVDSSEGERMILVQQAKDFAWGYCYAYAGVEDLAKALKGVLDELFDLTDEETTLVIETSV